MRFSFTGRLINGNLLLTRRCEQFLLYIIIKLSVIRTKHWAKARGKGAVKDSNGDDNENDKDKRLREGLSLARRQIAMENVLY